MTRRRHEVISWSIGCLMAAMILSGACPALAQPDPATAPPDSAAALPDTTDNFTGTLLFIHGQPQKALPVDIANLRATGVSRLEAALRGRGHRTVDRAVMENKVMKWRIRGSHLISADFLAELRDEQEVGQVLVATLLSDNARFLMTVRLIDTETGRLTFVNLVDVDLPLNPFDAPTTGIENWRHVLDRVCLEIVPPWTPAPGPDENSLLVLPTRGIASDPAITSAAAHSLLKALIGQGLILIDPALVEVTMLDAGLPSHWLDHRGRRVLQDRFDRNIILVSELVSYDRNLSRESSSAFAAGLTDPGRRNLTVFSMSMRTVDLVTGTALRSAQIIHEKPPATGWFGTPIYTTLLQELETTSHELWAAFSPEAEDN